MRMDEPAQQEASPRPESSSRPPATRKSFLPDGGAHLLDRLSIVYRYRHVAAGVFLLVLLAAMLRTFTTAPVYRAQVRLMIEKEDERTTALSGAFSTPSSSYWEDPQVYYQTQYRILASRELARRVVKLLNADNVGALARPRSTTAEVTRLLSGFATSALSRIGWIQKDAPSTNAVGASADADPPALDAFLDNVSIEPVQNSRLVDVVFVSSNPSFAARAVNALADEYVQQNTELRRQNMDTSLEWISAEVAKQQKKMEESERAMALYREEQNALSLEERQNIVVARLNQLNDAVTKARTVRVQKEALHDQIKALGDVSGDTIPAILQNSYIQSIKTRLAELQREKAALLERYGEKYPDVLKLNATLQDVSRQLESEIAKAIDAIRNDYQGALAEERTLAAALEEQKGAAMDLNRKSVSYTVLEREAHSNRQVYETLLQRENELQVLANSRGSNVRVTDRAYTPVVPFTPRPLRDLALASIAGLVLSLGLVFFLDYLNDTVKNPDDVTDKLKIPFLGLAPKVKGDDRPTIAREVPHEFGEAFRSLRTALMFSSGSEATRLVMVASAQPLEGKTTVACNLALALGLDGARVLLIDADMRRPALHRVLGVDNGTGLSHVLTGQASLDTASVALEQPGVRLLTAGIPPPNPSELLGSGAMKSLLDATRNGEYDWVIIDTPPVLAVTDAVVLSPLVSGIAFVIGCEMTRCNHAARALDTLLANRPRLLGAILNHVDLERNKYYYRRYYGYKNRNYYFASPA